ncbi:MAG: ribosome assembly cofactor RimP [Bacteroidales bacterium]|nr:ribosome assembly cofactor RimP [Bacteroidales bacterium]
MIDKMQVIDLVRQKLDGTEKFLVDVRISTDNRIYVSIDSDDSIQIDDCIELSRYIESRLNRDVEDYELNVSSAGLDEPLKLIRQYKKNVGQDLTVTTKEGEKIVGRLTEADDEKIALALPARKKSDAEHLELPYAAIRSAYIVIHF